MADPDAPIESLLEQCILALEARDAAAVDALLEAHPAHAAEVRQRLDQLAGLGILHAPATAAAIPERLGEFRLLRQIGRGGMGIVYLATQDALQRSVALKLVHPEQLFFRGARERFRREVLAVARLQHPGIVPILTCGEAEGIPYYAMELVAGASLAEVLLELTGTATSALAGPLLRSALQRAMAKKHDVTPLQDADAFRGAWSPVVARLALAAAEALAHAHAQGVLHRDVKPSNLLLTTLGVVRLIDFGLASAEGEQRLTRSGATFGSLPYMAPEQVRGRTHHIDRRTDVYQLGVTLYELLTLTLPHGDGHGDTRERILAGHVEPPSRRDAQVHADLEAVCLMAMAAEPGRRYASADALAADLRAFLAQAPVTARRPTPWLRLQRWCRRHPGRAALGAAAALVLVPGPLVFALQQSRANARISRALADADRQRQLAEGNLDEALAAVDQMLLRTAEARLARTPRAAELRRQLLQDALAVHERLMTGPAATSPRLQEARARSLARLGAMHADLGELDRGRDLLEAARDALTRLTSSTATPDRLHSELANCAEELAEIYGRTGPVERYELAQRQAYTLYRDLATRLQDARHHEASLRTQLGMARLLARQNRPQEAFAMLDDLDARCADPAASPSSRLSANQRIQLWAECAEGRGVLLAQAGDPEAARAAFAEALRRLDTRTIDADSEEQLAPTIATVNERLGMALHQLRRWDQAAAPLQRAARAYERLAAAEPAYPRWRAMLARVLGSCAENRRQSGDRQGLLAEHDRAIALLERLLAECPADPDYQRTLAVSCAERAGMRRESGQRDAADADFERAVALLDDSLQRRPDDAMTRANLAAVLCNHSQLLDELDEPARATAASRRALELARQQTGTQATRTVVEILQQISQQAMRRGDDTATRQAVREACDLAAAALPAGRDAASLATVAWAELGRGTVELALGTIDDAVRIWTDALPVAQEAAAGSPFGRELCGTLLLRLCDAETRRRRPERAREWFRQAMALGMQRHQVARMPPLPALFDRPEFADLLPADAAGR